MTVNDTIFDPAVPAEHLDQLRAELAALKELLGPDVQFPPNCYRAMQGLFVRYESRSLLVSTFPVQEATLNPVGVMQGGYIAAAIDNTMGPLSYLAARCPCLTLDMHVQFIRAAKSSSLLTVTARVVSRGRTTLLLEADVHDERQRLLARASANALAVGGKA